jgi:hypothetical protein
MRQSRATKSSPSLRKDWTPMPLAHVKKYEKVPRQVEALLWDGTTVINDELSAFAEGHVKFLHHNVIVLQTPTGAITVAAPAYIVKGATNDFYPVDMAGFQNWYKPVE